jgi:hypothetical protein
MGLVRASCNDQVGGLIFDAGGDAGDVGFYWGEDAAMGDGRGDIALERLAIEHDRWAREGAGQARGERENGEQARGEREGGEWENWHVGAIYRIG